MCSLQELDLSLNKLTHELASIIQTLDGCTKKSLLSLDLSYNQIWGSIPDTIDTLPSLRELYLYNNHLNGTISQRLGTLSMLETLHLSSNFLKGTLSINHFSNLSRLKNLLLYDNSALVLDFNIDWVPPFQLDVIRLESCKLGPMFPKWLLRQISYSMLDISEAGISDRIPMSFWKSLSPNLRYLNMSHNNIYGTLPDLQKIVPDIYTETLDIDMSYNNIEGIIPMFPKNVTSIYLSSNMFTDPIPFLCPKFKTKLHTIDLSNNSLSGELPNCWIHFDQLMFLNLDNNSFSGRIPTALGYLEKLQLLHLGKNKFSKDLPRSLMNCTSLVNLNLGHNSLSGHIPIEIGYNLRNLSSLILKNNSFIGEIPLSICKLSSLQILDLSINHITGVIPKCIHNLTAMQNGTDLMPDFIYDEFFDKKSGIIVASEYSEVETIMWKRKEWDFNTNNLGLLKAIDMSQNRLQGEIPFEISLLEGLVTLNLSRNHLHGNITAIGHLTSLNALDLSNNHLSGEIPTSLADLNSLGTLDLSNNHFFGKIPNGPHLQTFDASSFTGNPELCGMPLPQCPWDQQPDNYRVNENDADHQDKSEIDDFFLGLYVSLVLGFIIGFWGVCGTLVLKRSWRHAFFGFFDDVKDKLYVMVFVNIAKVRRRL